MKSLTTILLTLLVLGGCTSEEKIPESITDMTNKLINFKLQLVECDSLKSCEMVTTDMSSYIIQVNHPENDGQLCNKYAKCYEVFVDLTQYGFSEEYIEKLSLFIGESIFTDD